MASGYYTKSVDDEQRLRARYAARPSRREGYGLSVRVVDNPAARNTYLSKGSFGWSGAFNTHFFIDPTEHVVGLFMTQIVGLASRGEIATTSRPRLCSRSSAAAALARIK